MVSESELDGSKMEIISSFLDTKSIDVAQKEAIISLFGRYSWGVLEHDKFKIIKLYSGENLDQKIIVVMLRPTMGYSTIVMVSLNAILYLSLTVIL